MTSPDVLRFDRFALHVQKRKLLDGDAPVELGARAFDLLRTLAQNPGRVLTKAELFASAWPGVTVDENNLQVQVSALRKIVGAKVIATVPGRGYQFTAGVTGAAAEKPVEAATPATQLFGRAHDLERLAALITEYPLVTVMGPGGVGKTAVARALSQSLGPRFNGKVTLVELAPVGDPALVPAAVAAALGLKLQPGPAPSQIAARLGEGEPLLILDNCEHQVPAVAALIEEIARAAPKTHIVTTSQARLGLTSENVYVLEPLATPHDVTLYGVEQSPAATLFAARAAQGLPGFELTTTNAEAVSDICHRLDGIPLALELAAARVGLLGVEGVRTRLDHRLKLLTKGQRGAVARHLTLRTALEWSYDLLTPDEQFVFRCLGVFRGGFTSGDVQAIATRDTIDEWAALDALSSLIDRSLVARKPGGDPSAEPRFTLLETMAEFAVAKSFESGEFDAARARHATHFTALAVAVGGRRPERDTRVNRDYSQFDLQHDNLRAAFDWSFSHDLPRAFRLGDCLAVFWRLRGHIVEGHQRLESLRARQDPSVDDRLRGLLLSSSQGICYESKNVARLESIADEGIALWTALDDPLEIGLALSWKGHSYALRSDFETSKQFYEKGLVHFRRANHAGRIAETLNNIGDALVELKRPAEACEVMTEALTFYRTNNDAWGAAFCREVLGLARFSLGELEQCGVEWRAAREGFDQVGHAQRRVLARINLTALALRMRDLAAAREHLGASLAALGDLAFNTEIVAVLWLGAQYCAAIGEPAEGVALFACARRWTDTWSLQIEAPPAYGAVEAETRVRGALSADAINAATVLGEGLTAQAALARVRSALRGQA